MRRLCGVWSVRIRQIRGIGVEEVLDEIRS